METVDELRRLIRVARGEEPPDLLLRGGWVLNVFTGEILPADVALCGGRIAGIGEDYHAGREVLDLAGACLLPGFIDAHVHIESSLLSPPEYARVVLPRGTTTVVCDPHEMANVLGLDGVRYILQSSASIPLNVFVTASSCVPATGMETAGARFDAEEISSILSWDRVVGLAEMMNVPGVLSGSPPEMEKLLAARRKGRPVDGHAPLLRGLDLNAYVAAGIRTDHESTLPEEALEKLRAGMILMIREGSAARNLETLLPVVTPKNARRCLLVSDDTHPRDLLLEGHMDYRLRKAVSLGIDPVTAVRMVTLNPAEALGLDRLGAIAPGYRADVVAVDDLREFGVRVVVKDGRVAVRDGRLEVAIPRVGDLERVRKTMQVRPFGVETFRIPLQGNRVRVIGLTPDQLTTEQLVEEVRTVDGAVEADPSRDLLKLAVIERHRGTGNVGLGLVRGFGLRRGAMASSVAHDSHNLIVVGANDRDMWIAVRHLIEINGGHTVVADGEILETLPLPIAGLLSDRPVEEVVETEERLLEAVRQLGVTIASPFITLSFLALPVIPELKLTDQGLVDVRRGERVGLEAP